MRKYNYDRHSIAPIDEVLPIIGAHIMHSLSGGPFRIEINEQKVKMNSLRLNTFIVSGCECVKCKLKASYFALERTGKPSGDKPYHLNLWGINENGEEILFTHDHILARCLGGEDQLHNTQTMCTICNFEKSKEETKKYHLKMKG